MAKKHDKHISRIAGRVIIIFIVFNAAIVTMGYTLIHNITQVDKMNKELKRLEREKVSLLDKEAAIQADIKRLGDSSYIARYIREKHFFSKENEIILRMDD